MYKLTLLTITIALITTACLSTNKSPDIISTKALDDGAVEITWNTTKGMQYEVLSSTDPAAPENEWKVETTITAQSAKTSWKDKEAASIKTKFYRIRELTPESEK